MTFSLMTESLQAASFRTKQSGKRDAQEVIYSGKSHSCFEIGKLLSAKAFEVTQ
jgi:hypothetical protein